MTDELVMDLVVERRGDWRRDGGEDAEAVEAAERGMEAVEE